MPSIIVVVVQLVWYMYEVAPSMVVVVVYIDADWVTVAVRDTVDPG